MNYPDISSYQASSSAPVYPSVNQNSSSQAAKSESIICNQPNTTPGAYSAADKVIKSAEKLIDDMSSKGMPSANKQESSSPSRGSWLANAVSHGISASVNNSSRSRRGNINAFGYQKNETNWFSGNSVVIVNDKGDENKPRNRDDSMSKVTQFVVGTIGIGAIGAGAWLLGKVFAEGDDAHYEYRNFKNLSKHWTLLEKDYKNCDKYVNSMHTLIKTVESIFERRQRNNYIKGAIVVTVIISGSAALAGSLMASSAVITAAVVIGVFAGASALFYISFNNTHKAEARDFKLLKYQVEVLNKTSTNWQPSQDATSYIYVRN